MANYSIYINHPDCLATQQWSMPKSWKLYKTAGIDIAVDADFEGFRKRVTDVRGVHMTLPLEPGTHAGQEKTVKVNFDGGNVKVLFKWRPRTALWEETRVIVQWSIYKAESKMAKDVIGLCERVLAERARLPLKPNGRISTAMELQHDLEMVDVEIAEAKERLNELQDRRDKYVSNHNNAIRMLDEYDVAFADVNARVDAMVEEFRGV